MPWLAPAVLLVLGAATGTVVCESVPNFSRDIAPILRQYCAGCHNDTDFEGDVSLERYADLKDDLAFADTLLKPGDPEGSYLIRLVTGRAKATMPPKDEPQLQPAEIETLRSWIAAGAKGPAPDEEGVSILSTLEVPDLPAANRKQAVTALALSPAGTRLALGSYGSVRIALPDPGAESAEDLRIEGIAGKVNAVHFLPGDPTRLVTASGIAGLKGVAAIWDLATGIAAREFGAGYHRDILYDAEFSPDGSMLATAGYDTKIALWEVSSGKLLRAIEMHNGAVFDLAFSPDGSILASASADETVKIWKVATGERLDTLGQPQGEQFAVAFTPDGKFVLAGGADNRVRMWRLVSTGEPRINPLRHARFAHEGAVVALAVSRDGRFLASSGDDRVVKLWSLPDLVQVETWDGQPDVVTALAFSDERVIHAARMDGSRARLPWGDIAAAPGGTRANEPPANSALVPDPGGQPVSNVEAHEGAEPLAVDPPVAITGVIGAPADADAFRFSAKQGEPWVLEVDAARSKSPLDSVVEVLTAEGEPIERVRLQAVRDSWFEFRGKDSSEAGDFRVFNWREMELNEYLYCNGEVVKLWLYPRGPDSGFTVYPGFGSRHTWFGTSALTHALGEPCYVVVPLPPDAEPLANGLPVFPIYHENDDDPQRRHGADSKLTFSAPTDGEFVARIRDVRGFGGDTYNYTLTIRRPAPDFQAALSFGKEPKLFRGSGRDFVVTAQRFDGFDGEIRIDVHDLPPGFSASGPLMIEAGQHQAMGVLFAEPDAPIPSAEAAEKARLTATASIQGREVTKETGRFGKLNLTEEAPKLHVEIAPDGNSGSPLVNENGMLELTIHPGETITAIVRAQRHDFGGRIEFGKEDSGRNLAHGLIVDNIGLNGLMIPEDQHEQRFFLTAADWVPNSTRPLHLRTEAGGHHASRPVLLHVKRR